MKEFTITTRGHTNTEFSMRCYEHDGLGGVNFEYDEVEIPGRDSPLIRNVNYKPRKEIKVKAVVTGDLQTNARNIKAWLCSDIRDEQIIFSDDPGLYYFGFLDNKLDIEEVIGEVGEVTLTFNVQPYKRRTTGDRYVVVKNNDKIMNSSHTASKPLFHIEGSGDITIKINDQELVLKDIANDIYIDSQEMEAYRYTQGELMGQNHHMYSDFPTLEPGINVFTITGTVSKLELKPRWRENA